MVRRSYSRSTSTEKYNKREKYNNDHKRHSRINDKTKHSNNDKRKYYRSRSHSSDYRKHRNYNKKKYSSSISSRSSISNNQIKTEIKAKSNFTTYIVDENQANIQKDSYSNERKLHLGNLPFKTNQLVFVNLINESIIQSKISLPSVNPIISSWISKDNTYAFIDCKTKEDADILYKLGSINVLNSTIKIGRPKNYLDKEEMLNQNISEISTTSGIINPSGNLLGKRICLPTKVLCFINIFKDLDTTNEDQLSEIKSDIIQECSNYGRVIYSDSPTLIDYQIANKSKTIINNFLFNFYVEFNSVEESIKVRKHLSYRKYNNKLVEIKYHNEEKLYKRDYEIIEELVYN